MNFFDKVKERIEKSKRPLLIFPQGTRVKLDDQPPFKKGVGRIYKALNLLGITNVGMAKIKIIIRPTYKKILKISDLINCIKN